ncbi:hypothetical protein K8I61_02580 [bacterium]|nr:hypothetical protein [bacterium]
MPSLRTKLQIREGWRGRIVAPPDDLRLKELNALPQARSSDAELDWALVFVTNEEEIESRGKGIVRVLREDGVLWFAYPKKTSGIAADITRDRGWDSLDALGLRAVRQIALDDTWSALRFRARERVKRKTDT